MTETKNEMGNPDFDLLFSNDTFKEKDTKEYKELSALYESTIF